MRGNIGIWAILLFDLGVVAVLVGAILGELDLQILGIGR
jgi:hypothetical protein